MAVQFRQATLPNGLVVTAEADPTAHTAAMGFFVKTGARDEDPAVMGVSHFLEHMMFKGTDSRTAEQVDQDFDNIGADHNAFTSGEMTVFHAHALPEHLPRVEEILSDILRPALREQDFEDEKPVILEEIAMYEDQPFWVLYERVTEAYFRTHPLAHRVLGTRDTIEPMQCHQMRAYFTQRYSADNTVVAMAGNLDFDAMVQHIEAHCGHWEPTQTARQYDAINFKDDEFTIRSAKVNRHYCIMLSPAPAQQDDDRYAAAILAQILGDAEGSRLYWALVETGLAEEVRADYDGQDQVGQFVVYFVCDPSDAERVEQLTCEQIDALGDAITEDDLVRVRSKIATSVTLHGELPAGRMQRLGRLWTYTAQYRSLEEELERIDAVTLDELRDVYQKYRFAPRVTGRMQPE